MGAKKKKVEEIFDGSSRAARAASEPQTQD